MLCLLSLAGVAATSFARGFWMGGAGWLLTAAVLTVGLRRDVWMRRPLPLTLEILEDGSLHVVSQDGRDAVSVARGSLFLGSGALLVLRGSETYRLFLGAGNVNADALAALRRLLRALRTVQPARGNFLY
jgi:hypothetical protein